MSAAKSALVSLSPQLALELVSLSLQPVLALASLPLQLALEPVFVPPV